MHAERDIIVNVVFPNLRKRFRSSGRELVDVDLRWGITEEQARRGEIAGLCLAEIDRCRPFFLGLIGERYGWVPPPGSFNPRLCEVFPILKQRPGCSITEIEFDYGALSAPDKAQDALFVIRKSAQPDEGPTKALRDRVRASGAVVATYDRPEDLAALLEELLGAAIAKRIESDGAKQHVSAADRLNEAFAQERRRNYQGAGGRFGALDAWAQKPGASILLVESEPGFGKSALIANWVAHHAMRHPQDSIVTHFLGASNESATPIEIMQRLVRLLAARAGDAPAPVQHSAALISVFAAALRRAGDDAANKQTTVVLALDGLNKLSEWDDLRWIPNPIPKGVKLIASALPGRAFDELIARGCARHEISPLDDHERRLMIETRLGQFAKTLDQAQLYRIASHALARSPIFLQTIVNELRVFGHFEELDARISEYLASTSVADLFDRVLARIEHECSADRTALIVTLICLSRSGLEENALLAITGAAKLDLAAVVLRLGDSLWEHDGRLSPSHDYLSQAVRRRYLQSPAAVANGRALLAKYFDPRSNPHPEWDAYLNLSGEPWIRTERSRTPQERQERYLKARERIIASGAYDQVAADRREYFVIDEEPPEPADLARSLEELPHQLAESGDAQTLRQLLCDLRWLNPLLGRGQVELRNFWIAAGRQGREAEADLCEAVAAQFPEHGQWTKRQWRLVSRVVSFLKDAGWAGEPCLALMRKYVELEFAIFGNASASAFDALRYLAALEISLGYKADALAHLEEAAQGHSATLGEEHPHALMRCAYYASALRASGKAAEARDMLEDIRPKVAKVFGASAANTLEVMLALANAYHDLHVFDRAQALRQEVLSEYRRTLGPDHPDTLEAMSAIAIAERQQGNYPAACDMHRQVLEKRRVLLGADHPATIATLAAYGLALSSAKNFKGAEAQLREAVTLASARADSAALARRSKRDLIDVLLMDDQLEQAMTLERELVADFERAGESQCAEAVESMRSYGAGLRAFGRLDESKTVLEKALAIETRRSGAASASTLDVQSSLAQTLIALKEFDQARKLLESVVALKGSQLSARDPDLLDSKRHLMTLLNYVKDYPAAIEIGSAIPREAVAEADENAIACGAQMAAAFYATKQVKQAIAEYEAMFGALVKAGKGPDTETFMQYAQACYADGQVDRARSAEEMVLTQWKATPDEPQQEKLASLMQIGAAGRQRFARGDYDGAEEVFRFILETETRMFGAASPHVAQSRANLASIDAKRRSAAQLNSPARSANTRSRQPRRNKPNDVGGPSVVTIRAPRLSRDVWASKNVRWAAGEDDFRLWDGSAADPNRTPCDARFRSPVTLAFAP